MKTYSDYKIDKNRTQNFKTEESTRFSFIDIIRNLIPRSLGRKLKEILKKGKKEINKEIKEIHIEFTKYIFGNWKERCEKMIEWEKTNEISNETKRNTKANQKEQPINYEKAKLNLEKKKLSIIDKAIDNIFESIKPSFSFFFSFILSLDFSGAVAVETN